MKKREKSMKKKKIINYVGLAACLLAIISFITIFFDAIVYGNSKYAPILTGMDVTFGVSIKSNSIIAVVDYTILEFNILNFLSYLILLIGLIFAIISLFKIGNNKLMAFISAILLIAGGIMLFMFPTFISNQIGNNDIFKIAISRTAFLTIGAVCAILGGLANLYKSVFLIK